MSPRIGFFGELSAKLIALAFVVVFVVLGIIGLVLPIIPGLLFLIVAAWLVGRHFPGFSRRLRGNRTLASIVRTAKRRI